LSSSSKKIFNSLRREKKMITSLVLKLKILFSSFAKQATLMRRSTVLSLPPQLVIDERNDLLVLASSDQLVLKLKILFSSIAKQATLMRRSTVLNLPPQLVFHFSYGIQTEVEGSVHLTSLLR
jgi:hypothetical protein